MDVFSSTVILSVVATVRAATPQALYQARPGRRVLVATDLADLQGPTEGTVELRLFWCSDRTFDLDEPEMLRWMYRNVLREAIREEELTSYLHGDTLVAVWRDLALPRGVRRAWEDHHPVLRATAPSA